MKGKHKDNNIIDLTADHEKEKLKQINNKYYDDNEKNSSRSELNTETKEESKKFSNENSSLPENKEKKTHYSFFKPQKEQVPNALQAAWKYDQTVYKGKVQEAVTQGINFLEGERSKPMQELYAFLAQKRQEIALELMPNGDELGPASGFGQLRTGSRDKFNPGLTFIPKEGRYASMYPTLVGKLERLQAEGNRSTRVVPYGSEYDLALLDACVIERDGIILSAIGFVSNMSPTENLRAEARDVCLKEEADKAQYAEARQMWSAPLGENPSLLIIHPSPEVIDKILAKVDGIYAKIQASDDYDERIAGMATIAWYLAQAMPCKRGSASIIEMTMDILSQRFKIPLKTYEDTVSLDLKAIFEPNLDAFIEEFKKSYGIEPAAGKTLSV